jgi:predicted Co/Zn/Cd cation transporter (cation efflux family)
MRQPIRVAIFVAFIAAFGLSRVRYCWRIFSERHFREFQEDL